MAKYIVIQDRPVCIGCGSCVAVADKIWFMDSDGLATCKGMKDSKLEIDEKDFAKHKEAADICPVECIKVNKK